MRLGWALALVLLAGCVTPEIAPAEVVRDLAPTGTLRAATEGDRGSADLARELAKRLRVPLRLVRRQDAWDVDFRPSPRGREPALTAATAPGHALARRYVSDFMDEMQASGFIDAHR